MSKHTVVFGASENPERYACKASKELQVAGHPLSFVSIKKGQLFGQPFLDLQTQPHIEGVHTITLYVGTRNLEPWMDYIFSLDPKRIIFNPGTEHEIILREARNKGIETVCGCTLVMLSTGQC